ncbi:hypothetical protein [Mycetocola miduiensis]|uniref:Uncharacterized protein n=1 Tax=Mycetocola miduiensis TaxID=995034 RepID=A0A1I4YNE8_9MICO|nr:hypothetical protein [Mycetocola miduiensis]SFN39526.1 hypothetical protein SAMN05216219_0375 [Mycetocola miduiensis]
MSDPREENAPDEALIGPGSTATGGGTSQDAQENIGEESTVPPLDPDGTGSTQLADERSTQDDL